MVVVVVLGWVGWVGLGWVGLGWVGLGWVGLGWVGLGWVGLGLDWVGLGWVGIGWDGLGWGGVGWLVGSVCVGGGGGSDKALTTMCFSIPPQTCTKLKWQNTWESDSRRPRHPEPSTTKN